MIDQRFAPYSALLLRVSLGILFLAHGLLLKVMTFTPAGTAKFFESLGYPGFFAYIVIIAEIGGGIALILGAYTRLVALLFVPLMIGATMQHIGNGWGFGNKGGGWEFPVLWIALLFVQAGLGSGAYALKLPTFGKRAFA